MSSNCLKDPGVTGHVQVASASFADSRRGGTSYFHVFLKRDTRRFPMSRKAQRTQEQVESLKFEAAPAGAASHVLLVCVPLQVPDPMSILLSSAFEAGIRVHSGFEGRGCKGEARQRSPSTSSRGAASARSCEPESEGGAVRVSQVAARPV